MLKRIARAGFCTALLLPAAAWSMPLSYNYLEIGYEARTKLESGGSAVHDDGYGIGGSVLISENAFLRTDYRSVSFDGGLDLNDFGFGIGFRHALQEATQIYGVASYENIKAHISGFGSASDDGYGLRLGIRSAVSPNFELNGDVHYADYGDGGDSTFFQVGGLYSCTHEIDLLANYSTGKYKTGGTDLDRDDIRVALRYNFKK